MKRIGIDQGFIDVYENIGIIWRAILPAPMISDATLNPEIPAQFAMVPAEYSLPIFREDSFDPVTRTRRGRFYVPTRGQRLSQEWALPHPVYGTLGSLVTQTNGWTERSLYIFDQYQFEADPLKTVALGSADSLWRVIGRERTITGEYLFTLKARHAFGILPEVDIEAIPAKGRDKVKETLEKLTDAAYREASGSIIDRARDAAQWCLATWAASELNLDGMFEADLGELIRKIKNAAPEIGERVLLNTADIVRILHARGKPNEQERRGSRPIMEDDAELAIKAIGFMLHEFQWVQE